MTDKIAKGNIQGADILLYLGTGIPRELRRLDDRVCDGAGGSGGSA